MTVEPAGFPFTHEQMSAEQYDALPEDLCDNIEIMDGMVCFQPKPLPRERRLAKVLCNGLEDAGRPDWHADMNLDVRLREVSLVNRRPDVIVYAGNARLDQRLAVSAVLLVVEVVSPGSESTDRVNKPLEYAEAGIAHYWRVEPAGNVPVIHTYALDPGQRVHHKTGEFTGTVKVEAPFPVEIALTDV
jgi:Uma2 family endonuclease